MSSSIFADAPSLKRINKKEGPVEGGTTIALFGQKFTPETEFYFSSSLAAIKKFYNSRKVTVTLPAHSAEIVSVLAKNTSGESLLENAFEYKLYSPVITSISPQSGLVEGGSKVIIRGKHFKDSDTWTIGGKKAVFHPTANKRPWRVVLILPTADSTGAVDVTVNSVTGEVTKANSFLYSNPAPILSSVSPRSAALKGGKMITLIGKNFSKGSLVKFGEQSVEISRFIHSGRVRVKVPAGSEAGPVPLSIVTEYGTANYVQVFNYTDTAELRLIAPLSGATNKENKVNIFGRNFPEGCQVLFNDIEQEIINQKSHYIRIKTKLVEEEGPVHIKIVCGDVTLEKANGFFFKNDSEETDAPSLRFIRPSSDFITGGKKVILKGSNFSEDMSLLIGNQKATLHKFYSATKAQFIIPEGEIGFQDVCIENDLGKEVTPKAFTYLIDAPMISNISPDHGVALQDSEVFITGKNFTKGMRIIFGKTSITEYKLINSRRVKLTLPALAPDTVFEKTSVDVSITNASGTAQRLNGYTHTIDQNPPTISHFFSSGSTWVKFPLTLSLSDDASGLNLSSFVFKLDGALVDLEAQSALVNYSPNETLSSGSHEFTVEVSDQLGNMASYSVNFSIDNSPPEFTLTSSFPSVSSPTSQIPFIGIWSDAQSGIAPNSSSVSLDGTLINADLGLEGFAFALTQVSEGEHEFGVSVYDNAGNLYTESIPFTITYEAKEELHSDLFEGPVTVASGINPENLRLMDVDKDGKLDIVYQDADSDKVQVIYQQ
ncbi:MAG: IPT/TIG domain-containing protein [Planctomycetes bacterium]|nr:IPT/TIG domain-containing protein [Planctomycetota bacterium]